MSTDALDSARALTRFCRDHRSFRRWYIARVFRDSDRADSGERETSVTLYFSPPLETASLSVDEPAVGQASLESSAEDDLALWESEDFDRPARLTVDQLRKVFGYPAGPLEEGMVFIEIPYDPPRFLQYTPQARAASEKVFRRILARPDV